jgi:biotin carboxyl carrier protein
VRNAEEMMAELTAIVAGVVGMIHVSPGDWVQAGDTVVTLESMKMEIAITSPERGRVADVLVRQGEEVELGSVLVRIEPG